MKCQVQWIDSQGKSTPDENDAVMMAHFHEPIWKLRAGGPGNVITGYDASNVRESIPICAEHYARVDASFRIPRGGWTFEPIELTPEGAGAGAGETGGGDSTMRNGG